MILLKLTYLPKFSACFSEMSDYIPEGKLDPTTFQSVMDAADVKYCLAKVSRYLVQHNGAKLFDKLHLNCLIL